MKSGLLIFIGLAFLVSGCATTPAAGNYLEACLGKAEIILIQDSWFQTLPKEEKAIVRTEARKICEANARSVNLAAWGQALKGMGRGFQEAGRSYQPAIHCTSYKVGFLTQMDCR